MVEERIQTKKVLFSLSSHMKVCSAEDMALTEFDLLLAALLML